MVVLLMWINLCILLVVCGIFSLKYFMLVMFCVMCVSSGIDSGVLVIGVFWIMMGILIVLDRCW